MRVLSRAGFIAEFPDDTVEVGGDIEVFGGRNVAVALGDMLKELGSDGVSAPIYDGENGWVFNFDYLGAWWGLFGVVATSVAWWFYMGRRLWALLQPLPRQPVGNRKG